MIKDTNGLDICSKLKVIKHFSLSDQIVKVELETVIIRSLVGNELFDVNIVAIIAIVVLVF